MLKDQLFQITNQKIQTEKEQKNKKIAELKKKSEDNTLYVWNKFITPGLQSAAKQGNFTRQFRLMENKDEYCYYCVAKAPDTFSYMNQKLHLYYDFPILIDGYCDINALLKILEQEGFQTAITNCEMAWSEYSSSKKD